MTSSETGLPNCEHILNRLLRDIDEEHLAHIIDEPIDTAMARYAPRMDRPQSLAALVNEVARFCALLRRRNEPGSDRNESSGADDRRLRDEAIDMLQQFYIGTHCDGLYAAYLDARDESQPGIAWVVERLSGQLKEHRKQVYIRRCFAWHIDPGDWHLKAALGAAIFRRCQHLLPSRLTECATNRFAEELPELIGLLQNSTSTTIGLNLEDLSVSPEMS